MTVVSLDMAYRSFLEVLAGSHPPRYAASLKPSSPRFTHSSADVACYTAKEQGRSRVHVYRKEGSAPPRRHGEMLLASNLHNALEQQRFRLDYQPIVSLTNREAATQRFELLLRLSAEGTTVPPDSFIPVAERYGLMGAID